MSAATDGFSAMMSFLPMRKGADDKCKPPPGSTGPAHGLAGQPRVGCAEKVLGDQPAGRCLLVPQHHEHDQLQLLERQRVARSGERALDDQLARAGAEDAGMLERE